MLKNIIITSIAATGLMLSAQASAHQTHTTNTWTNNHTHRIAPPRPAKFRVNKEQREQATMIKQGIKTCQITPNEAQRLYAQQDRIKNAERRMRADGLQNHERRKLKKRLHKARVRINRLTQNGKHCRTHYRNSHDHHGDAHRGHNGRGHSTWSNGSGRGSISISVGH